MHERKQSRFCRAGQGPSPPAKTPAVPHRLEKGLAGVVVSFRRGVRPAAPGGGQGLGNVKDRVGKFDVGAVGNLNNDVLTEGDAVARISLFHIVNL